MKTRNLQYRFLTELGKIIHKAKSGRLILKLLEETQLNPGDIISDAHGKKIGNVNELIGSVNAPYASVILFNENFKPISGEKVFRFISKSQSSHFIKRDKKFRGQKLRRER
jgi:RNA-binding protein